MLVLHERMQNRGFGKLDGVLYHPNPEDTDDYRIEAICPSPKDVRNCVNYKYEFNYIF